jgi:uracil-DNA glycosylase
MSGKQQELDQIAADILNDNVCPDLAKLAINMVFGEGNPDADVMFIGEAPGRKEDESGKPFVGASGKLLSELLEGIGLDRSQVYITSIVKFRPPNNRDPKPAEKTAFMPYLQSQIEVIKPKVIVTLGRHGANCFLPDLKIGEAHGQPQQWNGHILLPLYHPAVGLYNYHMRGTLAEDFAQITQILKKLK